MPLPNRPSFGLNGYSTEPILFRPASKPTIFAIPTTLILKIARTLLLVQLAFMFGGGVPYLDLINHGLLYAFYFLMLLCSGVCWNQDIRTPLGFRAMSPYILWFLAFSLWLVSIDLFANPPLAHSWDVVREIVRAFIVWLAVAAVLPDRDHLLGLARWIVIGAAINAVVSCLTPSTPWLFALISRINDSGYAARYAQVARSVGLWGNANQAGHAFLFAALLSMWGSGLWACLAWVAALAGVVMTASRQATYLLALTAMVYLAHLARSSMVMPKFRILKTWLIIIILLGGLFAGYYSIMGENLHEQRNIQRVFAFKKGENERLRIMALAYHKIWQLAPFSGSGPHSFRGYLISYGPAEQDQGCHNIYLAIWGEGGLFMLMAYLLVMAWGLERIFRAGISPSERLPLLLLWACYMLIGLTYHGQMRDFNQVMFVGMLFALPVILARPGKPNATAAGGSYRE